MGDETIDEAALLKPGKRTRHRRTLGIREGTVHSTPHSIEHRARHEASLTIGRQDVEDDDLEG